MATLLEKYRKQAGTGPNSTINLADWNGLIDELSITLAGLIKKGADFDAVAAVAIGVLLDRINEVLGPAYDQVAARGAQIEALYAAISGSGISADSVIESATRIFLTDARRAAILADLRGGVAGDGDTLGKLYTMLVALKGNADAAHDSLGELAALVDANTSALAARLRFDTPQPLTAAQKAQLLANLAGTGLPLQQISILSAAVASTTAQSPFGDAVPNTGNTTLIIALVASLTPKTAGNKIRVRALVQVSLHGLGTVVVALFQNGGANAVATNYATIPGADYSDVIECIFETTAPSLVPMTFQVGVAGNNGYTTTVNGINTSRLLGGTTASTIEIMEMQA